MHVSCYRKRKLYACMIGVSVFALVYMQAVNIHNIIMNVANYNVHSDRNSPEFRFQS